MKQIVPAFLLATLLLVSTSHAEPKPKKDAPIEAPVQIPDKDAPAGKPIEPNPAKSVSPSARWVNDYQGDPLDLVLRTLARQAKVNIVLADSVTGTVNMRIENKTPREAIEIIATAKELILEEKKGVIYVRPKNPPPPGTVKAPEPEKAWDETISGLLTPALIKMYDTMLDYETRPETAQKIAKGKKVLYDALIAEGFTKDEAFRIILTDRVLSLPIDGK